MTRTPGSPPAWDRGVPTGGTGELGAAGPALHGVALGCSWNAFGFPRHFLDRFKCKPALPYAGRAIDPGNCRLFSRGRWLQKTGYLAEPFSAPDLAQGIQWVLDQPLEAHAKMCRAAHDRAQQRFDSRVIAQQYMDLYREILCDAEA